MILPDRAMVPIMATNPKGTLNNSRDREITKSIQSEASQALVDCASRTSIVVQPDQRQPLDDVLLSPRRIFHGAPGVDAVAAGQLFADRLQAGQDLLHHGGRLLGAWDVCQHCHRGQPVPTPDDAFLEAVLQSRDLLQGNAASVPGGNGQTRQVLQLVPLLAGTAQQYLDQLVTVAELADPIAGELAGEEAGHIGGTQAQGPGA